LIRVDQVITLLLVGTAAAGAAALVLRRIHNPLLWLPTAAVAYLVVISGGPEAYSRFRVPIAPLLAVLAAAAARAWSERDAGSRLR
jgi:hypothetical protein